jgi:hypothetical protein
MTLPDHNESFVDGAVPFATQSAQEITVLFGTASAGPEATLQGPYLRTDDVLADFTSGVVVQAAAKELSENRGVPVYISRVHATTAGANGTVTHSGTGPLITLSGTPVDDYQNAQIAIVAGGTLGTATFEYTLDGVTWSQPIVTAATYALGASGITANFPSGTYVAAETYSWASTAPYYTTTDLAAAYAQADSAGVPWKTGWVLGQVGGANDAAKATAFGTVIAACKSLLATSLAAHRIRALVLEAPAVADTLAGDTALGAVIDALDCKQIAISYGFCFMKSPLDGLVYKRSSAWPAISRIRGIGRAEDPKWVGRGPLCKDTSALLSIEHDEYKREGPNGHRLITLRTFEGLSGFYITNAWLFAVPGSDYRYVQMWRVISDAARIARATMLPLVGKGVRTYPGAPNTPDGKVAGAILEEDAVSIEGKVNDVLLREITAKGDAEKVWIEITRTNPLKLDETLKYRLRVRMPGYISIIDAEFGFAI